MLKKNHFPAYEKVAFSYSIKQIKRGIDLIK